MSGKYALIFGNTDYSDPALAKLSAPGRDAQDLARVLKDPIICGFDDVRVAVNTPSSSAIEAIDEFFDGRKPDDLLVLYFSGHGIRDELGSLYLAFTNTVRTRLRSTALKAEYIREAMDESRSKRQVLVLDCCNSGAFPPGTKAELGGVMGLTTALQGYGRYVLTASDATQFAWEGDRIIGDTSNSLFTHFLVQGLEGDADRDSDGTISVDDLYDYAFEQISRVTPKQTPTKSASRQEGEIVLRQITRIQDIKPVSLADDLQEAIADSRTFVRLGAVEELAKLLQGKNLGLARSAREALDALCAQDDSLSVRRAAGDALAPILAAEQDAAAQAEQQKAEAARPVQQKAEAQLPQTARVAEAAVMQPIMETGVAKPGQPSAIKEVLHEVEAAHLGLVQQIRNTLVKPAKGRPSAQHEAAQPRPSGLSIIWMMLGSGAAGAILTSVAEWSSSTSRREAAITIGLCGLCIGFSIALGWLLDRTVTRWRSLLGIVGGWAAVWAAGGILTATAMRSISPEQAALLLALIWALGGLLTGGILHLEHVLPSWRGVGLVTLGFALGGVAATLLTALAAPGISSAQEAIMPFVIIEALAGAIGGAAMLWLLRRAHAGQTEKEIVHG